MKVITNDQQLSTCITDYNKAVRYLGQKRAKLLQKRLSALLDANTLQDVKALPGHFHELVDNRKGQWACDLDQPYRLIFEPIEKPIPTSKDGNYLWVEIKGIELIEITNYHGK